MQRSGSRLISMAALVIIFAAIRSSQEIILPFLLAIFIAIIAAAPVSWLRQRKVPEFLSISLVLVAILLLLAGASLILTTSVQSFSKTLPDYLKGLQGTTNIVAAWFSRIGISLPEGGLSKVINPGSAMYLANSLLGGITQLLSNTFLIAMTVIFLLLEASVFSAKIESIRNDAGRTLAQITAFLDSTKHYMALKALISLLTGVLISAGMFLLGVDYPLLWGFLAFLLNFIPNIGSIIAAVPAMLLAWLQLGISSALAVAAVFLAVNMLVGNVVEPKMLGRGMGMSTLVVFLSLVFWGWLLGPVGMLLSVPLTMLVKFWAEESEETGWIAVLLSSAPNRELGE